LNHWEKISLELENCGAYSGVDYNTTERPKQIRKGRDTQQ
jgi:hypothetical protein